MSKLFTIAVYGLLAFGVLALLLPDIGAAQASGVPVSISTLPEINVSQGGSQQFTYLVSGGGNLDTSVEINNSAEFNASGISISLSNSSGVTPFGGWVYIRVSPTAQPGLYQANIIGLRNGVPVNSTVLKMVVLANPTARSPTVLNTGGIAKSTLYMVADALVIILIVLYAVWLHKKGALHLPHLGGHD